MKHILQVLALSGLIAGSGAGVSSAAPIDLGTFTGQVGSNSATFGKSTIGSFDDLFTFTLTRDSTVAISVTNGFSQASQIISPFTLSLFGDESGTGAALMTADAITNDADHRQTASLADALALGSYSFRISGDSSDSPSYGGSISVSVSTVPLPAAAPLFGLALLVFGVAGVHAKRKAANPAA